MNITETLFFSFIIIAMITLLVQKFKKKNNHSFKASDIIYIKDKNGHYYETPVDGVTIYNGESMPVCRIKEVDHGGYLIEYHDELISPEDGRGWYNGYNQVVNSRIVLYPSGIQEIKYKINNK